MDVARTVTKGREDQLAGVAKQHHPTGDGNPVIGLGAGLEVAPSVADLRDGVGAIESVGVGLVTGSADLGDTGESPLALSSEAAA